jgi:hypothetical protein
MIKKRIMIKKNIMKVKKIMVKMQKMIVERRKILTLNKNNWIIKVEVQKKLYKNLKSVLYKINLNRVILKVKVLPQKKYLQQLQKVHQK